MILMLKNLILKWFLKPTKLSQVINKETHTPPIKIEGAMPTKLPSHPKLAHLILELGSLEVFYFYSDLPPYPIDISKVYWKDDRIFPGTFCGPYASIFAATKDYSQKKHQIDILSAEKRAYENTNLIKVDFRTKKRIDSTSTN